MSQFEEKPSSKSKLFSNLISQLKSDPPRRTSNPPQRTSKVASDAPQKQRTWDPKEWEEDQRYVEAMELLAAKQKRDALRRLERLFEDDPGHLYGRRDLFHLALELGDEENVKKHVDWVIGFHSQQGEPQDVCKVYREVRVALPDLQWVEKTLVQALLAGDKTKEGRVVVDATKLLLYNYPQSPALPRAFIASADVQLNEGRPDLAKTTLKNVIARFPLDPLVTMAERKLAELG